MDESNHDDNAWGDPLVEKLEQEMEILNNRMHDSLDQVAQLRHELRIEKDHNLSLSKERKYWENSFNDLALTFDDAVNRRIESERKLFKLRGEQFEVRIEELKKIGAHKDSRIKELSLLAARLTREARNHELEIRRLEMLIETKTNEKERIEHLYQDLLTKIELAEELKHPNVNDSIVSELEFQKSNLKQSLHREELLTNQITKQIKTIQDLEEKIKEVSGHLLKEQKKCLDLAEKNGGLNELLNETIEENNKKIDLVVQSERIQKLHSIQDLTMKYERELSERDSILKTITAENEKLMTRSHELQSAVLVLDNEKITHALALDELQRVIFMLENRPYETRNSPQVDRPSSHGPDEMRPRRLLRRRHGI